MANRLSTYFSRKMFLTIAFGFSSGLPLALVFGTLSLWLKDYHIAYRTIGAFSLLRLPYSFKWLWAPLVEHTAVPGLKKLGKRRSWALFSQAGLFAGLVCLSGLTPDDGIIFMAMAALFISFFSATQDIVLDAEYTNISADTNGNLWLAEFMEPLISWKDGAKTASYEGPDYVTMHPSGTWGVSWFSSAECEKITLSGGAVKTEPIVFKEVDLISHLLIDENHIYVTGSAADESGHKIFVYDTNGALQLTLADSDGSGMGSVTFVTETANGYLALDGNMREVVLWTKDGAYIGEADDSDLFGTSYPWFCGGTKLADGSILAIMTEDRADESAMELVAFKLSGF